MYYDHTHITRLLRHVTTIVILSLFAINGYGQTQITYDTPGPHTFTVPAGVTSITVECWGGGGGGSSQATNGRGGGGGGGAYARSVVNVVPGNLYNIVVGAGGGGSTDGENSFFGASAVVAAGGKGGVDDANTGGAGGSAAASTGEVYYAGGNGGNGNSATGTGGGGGGAGSTGAGGDANYQIAGKGTASDGGDGAEGHDIAGQNGYDGHQYGGGGSGSRRAGTIGGSGAGGQIKITYTADNIAPSVSLFSPADNSLTVGINDNLIITFSENVRAGTSGNIIIYNSAGTVFESIPYNDARISYSNNTVTINPTATFTANASYYVQISNTAIRDMAGNMYAGINNTTTWNFTVPPLYFRSRATGNWNAASTWETSPDNVIWTAAAYTPTAANSIGILVQPLYPVTITASVSADDLTVNGTLTINGGVTLTIANGAANPDMVVGVAGNVNNAGIITTTGTVSFNGTYTHAQNNGTIPASTWNSGSKCTITGYTGGTPSGLGQSFSDFILNCAGRTLTIPGTLSVGGVLTITAGTLAGAGQVINLTGNLTGAGALTFGAGTLNIAGNNLLTGVFTCGTGTVNYNGAGAQTVAGVTYNNLTIGGGNTKTIQGNTTVRGILNLFNGNLSLGSGSSNLTLASGATITTPASFNNTHMIVCDGSGSLIKQGNVNGDFVLTLPIGTGTAYTPVQISGFTATAIAPSSTVRVQASASAAPGVSGTHPLNRHWITSTTGISGSVLANISFQYIPSDIPAGGTASLYEIVYKPSTGNWGMPGGAGAAGDNPLRATAATTLDATWTGSESEPEKHIFYSYESGSWDEVSTWTLDPSGTQWLNPNSYTPSTSPTYAYDEVIVLSGRTVIVPANNKTNKSLTVIGTLDLGTTTGHSFITISGTGRIRLAGDNFPAGDVTDFITPGQGEGTVEYYGTTRNLNVARTFFAVEVNMNAENTLTLLADYVINGSLSLVNGIFSINNNSAATPRNIKVYGNVTVETAGRIATGTANARHQLDLYGDFTNNGEVRFTNRTAANYASEATDGIVDVNFLSENKNQSIICRGLTNFYRIEIDKGTDFTYVLNIDAASTDNFNLFGYANEGHGTIAQLTTNNNALGLIRGTVRIGNSIEIPLLTLGSNYNVSEKAQLWIDRGIVRKNSGTSIVVYGKVRITNGLLEARIPSGITFHENGILSVEGGTINANQIRTTGEGTSTYGGYVQAGGTVNVLGGSTSTDYYVFSLPYSSSVFNMGGGTLKVNTSSANGGILINSAPENIKVTGGTVIAETQSARDFQITSTAPFWNFQLRNTTTTARQFTLSAADDIGPADIDVPAQPLKVLNDFRIWGKESGGASYPAIDFIPGTNDVYIGGSFFIESGSQYIPISGGTPPYDAIGSQPTVRNTTYFIKTAATEMTEVLYRGDASNPLEFGHLVIDRTNGYEVRLASVAERVNESVVLDVNGSASVLSGTLNQSLFTIRTWGAITNNDRMGTWYPGITPSQAQIQLVENPDLTLSTGLNAVFGNVQVNVTPPSVLTLTSDVYIERMEYVKGLIYLKGYNLKVDNLWNMEPGIFQNIPTTSYLSVLNSGRSGSSMIYTDGKASDGGLTLRIAANSQTENENNILNNFGPLTFPLGFTPNSGTTLYFRPAQMVINNYSSPGYITIRPVMGALPTTSQTGGEVLQHYWRVSHSGFTTLPTVAYRFYYRRQIGVANVDLSTFTNETNYVPGKVLDEIPYTRQYENGNDIFRGFIDANSRAITINGTSVNALFSPSSAGITLENANYSAGVTNRFTGSVLIYYSRDYAQEARWNIADSWTRSDILNTTYEPHDSRQPAATTVPGEGDVAVIGWIPWSDMNRVAGLRGQPHGIWVTDTRQVAEVVFTKMTDAGGNPVPRAYRSSFQFRPTLAINGRDGDNGILRAKLVKGEGLFWNRGSDPDYTIMDIGDFARQDSSYVIYENFINGRVISNTPALLPNIYIANDNWGANNHDFTFANDINTTGNVELIGNVNLLLPNGVTGNINAGRNLLMFEVGTSGGGAQIDFRNSGTARKVTVHGDMLIRNGNATVGVRDAATTGTVLDHELHIYGNIIQTSAGSVLNLAQSQNIRQRINLYLDGSDNMTYNRTNGTIPNLYRLIINKGNSLATSAQFNATFNLNGPTSGAGLPKALELQNGLFIVNEDVSINLTTGNDHFAIPSTSGLEMRLGTANANGGSGIALDGLLLLSGGNVNMGGGNNPIEYSVSGNATIQVTGGTLTVGGQIRRSPTSDVGILRYHQTGGTVIAGSGAAPIGNRGVFEILNPGSSFTMTGGDLYIARSQTNPTISAFYFDPASFNIGEAANIHIGHSSTPASQTIGIFAGKPLPRLRINNSATLTPKVIARLDVVTAVITGLLQIDAGTTFDANGLDLTLNGDMTATGTFIPRGNTTFFSSNGPQTVNGGGTVVNFYNLDKTMSGNLMLNTGNTPLLISNALSLLNGTFSDNGNTIIVKGNMLNNATHINNGAGDGIVMNGDIAQVLTGNGTFGKLTINNPNGVSIPVGNQFTISRSLKMQAGVLNIGKNLFEIGLDAVIEQSSPFSVTNMIETNTSFTDNGLRKIFRSGSSPIFTFPIGSNDKYTPVTLTVSANGNSTGSITVKPANEIHPSIMEDTESGVQIIDKDNALLYYWTLNAEGITGFSAVARMYYTDTDVKVTAPYTVADYHTASLLTGGAGTWLKFPKTDFDETNKQLVFRFANTNDDQISGDYTAGAGDNGLNGAIPDFVSRYETNNDGNWTTGTIWNPNISGGPNGAIVKINAPHTVDITVNNIAGYMTEIYGTLNLYSTSGHRLGIVSGSGTIYLERGEIPAAVYDEFFSPAGGTLEFGGTTGYEILGNITLVNHLRLSGTGERRLPNNNFTLNGNLTISGGAGLNVINYHNRKISIKGDLTRTSGLFEAGSGADARLAFIGTLPQTITGSFLNSNALNNLEVNNVNGVTILNDVEVDRELKLVNGLINVAPGSLFRINYGAVVLPAAGSSASFVNGTLTKEMMNGNSFTFPVGSLGGATKNHGPITLQTVTGPSGINDWRAGYYYTNATLAGYNTESFESPIATVSHSEYWNIEAPAGGASVIRITLDGSSDVASSLADLSNLRVVGWNAGDNEWEIVGTAVTVTGTSTSGIITTTSPVNYDNYTFFTLASVTPVATGTATITSATTVNLCSGLSTTITVAFTGEMPYVLTYTAGATPYITPAINASSYNINVSPSVTTVYTITGITASGVPGTVTGNTTATVNVNPVPVVSLSRSGSGAICEGTLITFTANAGLASYNFRVNGVTVQNGAGRTYATSSLLPGVQSVDVIGTNSGGCSATSNAIAVTVNPLPDAAGAISGEVSVCRNVKRTYTIGAIPNATSYTWSANNGATIAGSGTTREITFPNAGTTSITVYGVNGCGNGVPSTLNVAVSTLSTPGAAGNISGNSQVCQGGTGYTYTVSPVTNATSYIWTYSGTGAVINGSGNSVTVDFLPGAANGILRVAGTNGCATGAQSPSFSITTYQPPTATINPANPSTCSGTPVSIIATPSGGTTPYTHSWTGTGAGSLSSTTIPNPLFNSGMGGAYDLTYTVTDNRGCSGSANAIVTVFQAPVADAGPDVNAMCTGVSPISMTGATAGGSYSGIPTWSGAGGTWTQNPDPALATFTPSTPSGSTTARLTLTGTNGCSNTFDTRIISWSSTPTQPGAFTASSAIVCQGETGVIYTVPNDPQAITYNWTYTIGSGAVITGTGNSVIVDFSSSATSGSLNVTAINSCGASVPRSIAVIVSVPPVATFSYTGTPYCPNVANPMPVFSDGGVAGVFSSTAGLVFVSASTGQVNLAASIPGNYTVTNTIAAAGGCGIVIATSPISIISHYAWTGASGTDWNNPANWSCGAVPGALNSVTILDVLNKPVLSGGTAATVSNLSVDSGASLTVNGNTIRISGTITSSGTLNAAGGTVELNGTAAQSIGAGVFDGNVINGLIISNNAGVTLLGPLNVSGIVRVTAGSLASGGNLTLLSTASGTALIDGSGAGSVTGSVTMQRYLPIGFGYKYFSSPFQSATVSELGDIDEVNLTYGFPLFYRYDENSIYSGWVSYVTGSGILNPLEGYAANFGESTSPKTVDVKGVVNNGNLSVTLYNHNREYTKGFSLVGNPYPSPIDWNAGGWTKTNIDDAIYYFRASTSDQYGGTYSSYVGGLSSDDGQATNIIPSMQAFLVHVTNGTYPVTGTLGVTNSVRITDQTHIFLKSAHTETRDIIRATAGFTDDTTSYDPLVIYFDNSADSTFDSMYDALKLYNTDMMVTNFYSVLADGQKLSINALPEQHDTLLTIPLGLNIYRDGEVRFRLLDNGNVPPDTRIYFRDALTGANINMIPSGEYKVSLTAGEYNNRFSFSLFKNLTSIPDPEITADIFRAYISHGQIRTEVYAVENNAGKIMVYDLTGKLQYIKNITESGIYDLDPALQSGMYIIRYNTGLRHSIKKLIVGIR